MPERPLGEIGDEHHLPEHLEYFAQKVPVPFSLASWLRPWPWASCWPPPGDRPRSGTTRKHSGGGLWLAPRTTCSPTTTWVSNSSPPAAWPARQINIAAPLAIDPTNLKALNGLGSVYRNSGQLDKAEAWFRKAVAAGPANQDSHANLGLLLMHRGRYGEGLKQLQQALAADLTDAAAYANLAQAFYETRQFDRAIQVYRAWLRIEPRRRRCAQQPG